MAFTTMHFAVGMAGAGVLSLVGCAVLRRGWRYTPLAMTLGGLWAIVPDMPRLFREDFPSLPLASTLGSKNLENWLHSHGNWCFFHRMLDAQPKEFALHGLVGILVLYNFAILALILNSRKNTQNARALPDADPAAASHESAISENAIAGRIGPASQTG